jgi:hypothetical protein
VVLLARERLRGAERLLGLAGQLVGVDRHTFTSSGGELRGRSCSGDNSYQT